MSKYERMFFESQRHPGLAMNRYGVVFAPRDHEAASDYWSVSWDRVPLRSGFLDLRQEIEDEAWESGLRFRRGKQLLDVTWYKPTGGKHETVLH